MCQSLSSILMGNRNSPLKGTSRIKKQSPHSMRSSSNSSMNVILNYYNSEYFLSYFIMKLFFNIFTYLIKATRFSLAGSLVSEWLSALKVVFFLFFSQIYSFIYNTSLNENSLTNYPKIVSNMPLT